MTPTGREASVGELVDNSHRKLPVYQPGTLRGGWSDESVGVILSALVSLFVDDGSMSFAALLFVGWITILELVARASFLVSGGVLIIACAIVLAEYVLRTKRGE